MKKINKLNRGFTLVETLVAISIFTVSILGLISVLTQSISNTYYARQKIIAAYLAQEGIEYMRNMRDTYVLYDQNTQAGWNAFNAKLTGLSSCNSANGCYFDKRNIDYTNHSQSVWKTSLMLNPCSSSTCPEGALLYDSATGKYNYVSGVNSGFTRKINVVVGTDQTKIISTVSWAQGSGIHNITFSESLFNWVE